MSERHPSVSARAFVLAACLLLAPAARAEDPSASTEVPIALTGGDACSLIEGLPGAKAPVRRARTVARALAAMTRAGSSPAGLARVHDRLERALARVLGRASNTFRRVRGKAWGDTQRRGARAFLRRHVQGERAILRMGRVSFEPTPALRAALMWSACRGGRREAAIRWGRRASMADEAHARAFASLLLLEAGREDEARELEPTLTGDSFLVAWVGAELASDPDARTARQAAARRRTTTPAQHAATRAQALRLRPPTREEPDEGAP